MEEAPISELVRCHPRVFYSIRTRQQDQVSGGGGVSGGDLRHTKIHTPERSSSVFSGGAAIVEKDDTFAVKSKPRYGPSRWDIFQMREDVVIPSCDSDLIHIFY
jgi:hypothetical protein